MGATGLLFLVFDKLHILLKDDVMEINKHKHVTMDYTLKNGSGEILDNSKESGALTYIHGTGSLIQGLEEALEGKSAGEKINVLLTPDRAYGERDESLVYAMKKEQFTDFDEISVGMQVHVNDDSFNRLMIITEVEGDNVTLDGNHPLAGIQLDIDVDIKEVRDASAGELEQLYNELNGCGGKCSDGCESC